jgi:polyisoprenoid-binding protein YceI
MSGHASRVAGAAFALLCGACGDGAPTQDEAKSSRTREPIEAANLWTMDYAKSAVRFASSQTGTPFEGEFEKFEAIIIFDPADLPSSSIDATIDMMSAKTGDRQRDTALPGSDWFKAKDFPTARFQSSNIVGTGSGTYVAKGELTIRGISRGLDLPFTLEIAGASAHAVGEAGILRTDFGVGEGEFADATWVDLEVKVGIDIWASR